MVLIQETSSLLLFLDKISIEFSFQCMLNEIIENRGRKQSLIQYQD